MQTYMRRVVDRQLNQMIRAQAADKRQINSHCISSSRPPRGDSTGPTIQDLLPESDCETSWDEQIGLKRHLETASGQLTIRQRQILDLMMGGCPQVEIAEALGLGRATVSIEVRRIRILFSNNGLRDFI